MINNYKKMNRTLLIYLVTNFTNKNLIIVLIISLISLIITFLILNKYITHLVIKIKNKKIIFNFKKKVFAILFKLMMMIMKQTIYKYVFYI